MGTGSRTAAVAGIATMAASATATATKPARDAPPNVPARAFPATADSSLYKTPLQLTEREIAALYGEFAARR
jgi:hypothetical protein